jgi:hypothetical protein
MTMKSDVIANIRTLQGYREQKVAAESTLARLKTEDLTALLAELSGDEYTVNEHGMVVASNGHDTDATDEGEITEEEIASEGVDLVENEATDEVTEEKPVDTAPVAAELLDVQPAKAKTGDRRSKYSDDAVINVSASKLYGNGKSASYQRRALLRNGMTVAQYIAAVVALQGNDANARRQLDGAIRHGLATVSEPITC